MTTGLLVGLVALAVQLVVGLFEKDARDWRGYTAKAALALLIFFVAGWALSGDTISAMPCIEPAGFLGEC